MSNDNGHVVDALFLGMGINELLHRLDKAGELHAGHRALRVGKKAWDRYYRRMIKARVLAGVQPSYISDEIRRAAQLHAEACDLVESLRGQGQVLSLGVRYGRLAYSNKLVRVLRRAKRRRARRMHKFVELTRMPL